jgi:malate dehydrogenase (oxaloacetate-decarboxylating)
LNVLSLHKKCRRLTRHDEREDDFMETFVQSVKKLFPKAILHFEDFGVRNARKLLEKYRGQLPCINDDIQGTAVVTLAAINAAAWVTKLDLPGLRMLVYGAGSAGVGQSFSHTRTNLKTER